MVSPTKPWVNFAGDALASSSQSKYDYMAQRWGVWRIQRLPLISTDSWGRPRSLVMLFLVVVAELCPSSTQPNTTRVSIKYPTVRSVMKDACAVSIDVDLRTPLTNPPNS